MTIRKLSPGELALQLQARIDYDPTGAKQFQVDLLQIQQKAINAEDKLRAIQEEVKKLQASGKDTAMLPDLDREAMEMIQVLNKLADEYDRTTESLLGQGAISKKSAQDLREYAEELRNLAAAADSANAYVKDADGKLNWQPMGQAQKMTEAYNGMLVGQEKVNSALTKAYIKLDQIHKGHTDDMAKRTDELVNKQKELGTALANDGSLKMTASSMARMVQNFSDLSGAMSVAKVNYEKLQGVMERGKLAPDDPLYVSKQDQDKFLNATIDNFTKARNRIAQIMADPGLKEMFNDTGLDVVLEDAFQRIGIHIDNLKKDLHNIHLSEFLGGEAELFDRLFTDAMTTAKGHLRDFQEASKGAAATSKLSFSDMVEEAKRLEKETKIRGTKDLFANTGLETAEGAFQRAAGFLSNLKKMIQSMRIDYDGKPFEELAVDDAFIRRFRELNVALTATGSLLNQIDRSEGLRGFLPEGADKVVERMTRELAAMSVTVNDVKKQGKGQFLEGLNLNTYTGTLGALNSGLNDIRVALNTAGAEGDQFGKKVALAGKMLNVGLFQEQMKGFASLNISMQQVGLSADNMSKSLPKIKAILQDFNLDALNAMNSPDVRLGDTGDIEKFYSSYGKAFGQAVLAVDEFQTELRDLEKSLDRLIKDDEKYNFLSPESLQMAKEYREAVGQLQKATPKDLAQLDVGGITKQTQQFLGSNQQNIAESAKQMRAAKGEMNASMEAAKKLADEMGMVADSTKKAAGQTKDLSGLSERTAGAITDMRDRVAGVDKEFDEAAAGAGELAQRSERAAGSVGKISQNRAIKELADATRAFTGQLERMGQVVDNLAAVAGKIDLMAQSMQELSTRMDQVIADFGKFSAMDKVAENAAEAAAAIKKIDNDNGIEELVKTTGHAADKLDLLTAANERLATSFQRIDASIASIANIGATIEGLAVGFDRIAEAQSRVAASSDNIDEIAQDINRLGESTEKLVADSARVVESQQALASNVERVGAASRTAREDLNIVNAELGSLHDKAQKAADGVGHLSTTADAAGGGITSLGDKVKVADGFLRTWDKRTDEIAESTADMLGIMKKAAQFETLSKRFEDDVRRISDEREEIKRLRDEFERYLDTQKKAGGSSLSFEKSLRSVGARVLALNGDFRESHEAMTRYATAYQRISEQASIFTRIQGVGKDIIPSGAEGRLARIRDHFISITGHAHDWRTEMKLIDAGIKETENKLFKAMGTMGKLKSNIVEGLFHAIGYQVTDLLQNAGYAVKQFVVDSVQTYTDFQQGIAQIYTIMPDASDFMRQKIADDVAAISDEFGYLQGEVLPALYQSISLGVAAPDATNTVETAAMAARASVAELASTLETGQALVNAYGGEIYDLAEIYDLLFYAIRKGSITMTDLNNQIAPITAVAGEVGVAFEDITAAMIVMSRQGDDMGSISRMLSNMLTQIQIPTTALGKAFQEAAGVGFREFIAGGGNLVEALSLIDTYVQQAGKGITEIVGGDSPFYRDQQAMLAAIELTGSHLDDLIEMQKGAKDSAGTMSQAYEEVNDTLWMASQRSAVTTEELKRQAGEALEPLTRSWYELKAVIGGKIVSGLDSSGEIDKLQQLTKELGIATKEYEKLKDAIEFRVAPDDETFFGNLDWKALLNPFDDVGIGEALDEAMVANQDFGRSAEEQSLRARVSYMALAGDIGFTTDEVIALQDEVVKTLGLQALLAGGKQTEIELTQEQIDKEKARQQIINEVLEAYGLAAQGPQGEAEPTHFDWWGGMPTAEEIEAAADAQEEIIGVLSDKYRKLGEDVIALDGDTLKLTVNGEVEKIRLGNIDTAEIEHDGEGRNMAYGQMALEYTKGFILKTGGDVTIVGKEGMEDEYERQLAEIFDQTGRSLEDELIQRGLAVQIDFDLAINQAKWKEQQQMALEAARQGLGVFQNDLVQAMYLEGSIATMPEISQVYSSITGHFQNTMDFVKDMEDAEGDFAAAQGEWVEGTIDNSTRIAEIQAQLAGDLTKERRSELDKQLKDLDEFSADYDAIAQQIGADLTENTRGDLLAELQALQGQQGTTTSGFTGDPEEIAEATEKIKELEQATKDYFNTLAFESFLGQQGGITKEVVDLGVALGMFTREQGDAALKMAETATAIEALATSAEFATLSVGDQTAAMKLLLDGWVTTAEEALGRIRALKAEQDAVISAFQTGYGTQIYWDMAAGEMPELPPVEEQVIDLEYQLTPEGQKVLTQTNADLLELTENAWIVTFAGDMETEFTPVADNVMTKVTEIEDSDPLITFTTEHFEAETAMDRLIAKTEDKTITYTYNVVVNGEPPDLAGGAAVGGPIYPGTWLVGEMGPELITVSANAYVTNNDQLRRALGGGDQAPQITVNIDARGIDRSDMYHLERAAKNGIVRALRSSGYIGR